MRFLSLPQTGADSFGLLTRRKYECWRGGAHHMSLALDLPVMVGMGRSR